MSYRIMMAYFSNELGYDPRKTALKLVYDQDLREKSEERFGEKNIEKIIKLNLPRR